MTNWGVWTRLGVVATVLWMIVGSMATYYDFELKQGQAFYHARIMCGEGPPWSDCHKGYIDSWLLESDATLAIYSVILAALIAALAWILVRLIIWTIRWVFAGRQSA